MSYLDFSESSRDELKDEEILQLSLTKNPDFFGLIIDRYQAPFLRKALSILKDEDAAKDAVQDAFVKIYAHGNSFRIVPGATFQSWGYKILVNTCLTAYRKVSRERSRDAGELDESLIAVSHDDGFDRRLTVDEFLSMLSKLPVAFSSVLHAIGIRGLTLADVAAEEKVSVGAVRTRLHRARKAFAKLYAEHNSN